MTTHHLNIQDISILDAISSRDKNTDDVTTLDENTTDYYTHKETSRQDEIYSDTLSDDDMWDSVSTHDHPSLSNARTNESTINNLSAHEPRLRKIQAHARHEVPHDVLTGTTHHRPTGNPEYVAIRISKLDLYLLFTLICSILLTSCAIVYHFNVGIIIVTAIFPVSYTHLTLPTIYSV